MNYLAHAYLSFNQPGILAGNMISDFVKGNKQYDYSSMIRKGIGLHRSIDSFTDEHPATKEMKKVFKAAYGLYAGPFADIVYDYFLANDENEFKTHTILKQFAENAYESLDKQITLLPERFQQMFPYMKSQDWLSNYRHTSAIEKSFAGMTRRAKYITESDTAYKIFEDNITSMRPCYEEFFPLLKKHAAQTLRELLNAD